MCHRHAHTLQRGDWHPKHSASLATTSGWEATWRAKNELAKHVTKVTQHNNTHHPTTIAPSHQKKNKKKASSNPTTMPKTKALGRNSPTGNRNRGTRTTPGRNKARSLGSVCGVALLTVLI